MNKTIVLALAAATLATAGCGGSSGGGGGGGNNVDNPAIRAKLAELADAIRSEDSELPLSLTDGNTVANPNDFPENFTDSDVLPVGGVDSGGTVTEVTVESTGDFDGNGAGRFETFITEGNTGTGFEFARLVFTLDRPSITFRDVPLGYAGLDPLTGEGQAFVLGRLTYTGTARRDFTNESTTGATLVDDADPGLPEDGTRRASFAFTQEFLLEFDIELTVGGLEATVQDIFFGSDRARLVREGGPNVTQLAFDFDSLVVGGESFNGNGDVVVPVGTDADPTSTITPTDDFEVALRVNGGVAGEGDPETDVEGDLDSFDSETDRDVDHATELDTSTGVADVIEADDDVEIESFSGETFTGFDHPLDGFLFGAFERLDEALQLPAFTDARKIIFLFR